MRQSEHFGLNLVEGTDLVNPLVQDVPNYESIDEQMYKNECNSIGLATELRSGTVHALTRQVTNAPVFRFQATSNFTAGDTFTVDGIQVTALTPSGETLASGAYIIGSEVLCSLRETLLTIYTSGGVVETASDSERLGGQLPSYYGTAEDVQSAISTAQASNVVALATQSKVEELEEITEYSTSEKIVGKWIDGKPIYRKTFYAEGNFNNSFSIDTTFNTNYVDNVISIEGNIYNGSYLLLNKFWTQQNWFGVDVTPNTGLYLHINGSTVYKYTITVEYTKK